LRNESKYNKENFNISIYNAGYNIDRFHFIINKLLSGIFKAAAIDFHHFLDQLAVSGQLLRYYIQNVNCIECTLPSISPDRDPSPQDPWPKTVQLHGRLDTDAPQGSIDPGAERPLGAGNALWQYLPLGGRIYWRED
jgi:NAD-dependent SIR2 family protein deacetylase